MYSSVDEYIAELVTRDEVVGFLAEIERLKEAVYKTGEDRLEQVLQTGVGEKCAGLIRDQLRQQGKMDDQHFQEEFLEEIAKKLRQIPIVNLELATQPSREFISRTKDKLSEYTGGQVVLDYKIIPNMIAGLRVAFGGKYYDFSVESMWPEIWAQIKDKLKPKA